MVFQSLLTVFIVIMLNKVTVKSDLECSVGLKVGRHKLPNVANDNYLDNYDNLNKNLQYIAIFLFQLQLY